jgi:diazepam-binding inhibitor (GABA receptor modulator, acyl-CoA-binding protein)
MLTTDDQSGADLESPQQLATLTGVLLTPSEAADGGRLSRQSPIRCTGIDTVMGDLKAEFDATVNYVTTAKGSFKPSRDLQLTMYALFKQASAGDVKGKKPGMLDAVGRAKYDAWSKLKGTGAEDAMRGYIDTVESLTAKHG